MIQRTIDAELGKQKVRDVSWEDAIDVSCRSLYFSFLSDQYLL